MSTNSSEKKPVNQWHAQLLAKVKAGGIEKAWNKPPVVRYGWHNPENRR